MEQKKIRAIDSFPVVFAAGTTASLLVVKLFRWELLDLLTVFLEPLMELGVIVCFLISLVLSVIHFIKTVRMSLLSACSPIALNLAALALAVTIPFLSFDLTMDDLKRDLNANLEKREKIVSMIQSGELRPNAAPHSNLISLPFEYRHLSRGGGEVMLIGGGDRLEIFFFTFRGVLDNFSGFIYASDGRVSPSDFNSEFRQIEKLKENWYWVSSY